jgi:NADPH:quinone reductase
MRAVEISQPGGPEVLRLVERPRPLAGLREVLIKVAAAGVNRPDISQRKGTYPPPPGASDIPGLEIAGVVVALGAGVTSLTAGDEVCALVTGGGYAEYCAAPEQQCLPVPRGLTLVETASLPETFFTVWSNVFERGRLTAGESILIQGGSSGIGVAAIQLASAFGSRVFATAGSVKKCAVCEQLGAERAINYRTEDFAEVARRATDGRGVDLVLDMVGGDYVPREIDVLAEEGRLVLIATMGGTKAEVDLRCIMGRRLTITGSMLRRRSVEFKGAIATALREKVWPLLEAGRVKPIVHATFPIDQASEAHRALERGEHVGKLVLVV